MQSVHSIFFYFSRNVVWRIVILSFPRLVLYNFFLYFIFSSIFQFWDGEPLSFLTHIWALLINSVCHSDCQSCTKKSVIMIHTLCILIYMWRKLSLLIRVLVSAQDWLMVKHICFLLVVTMGSIAMRYVRIPIFTLSI